MESTGGTLKRSGSFRAEPADVAAWLVPFVLIVYVALRHGGYDTVSRGEAGIVVWFGVAVATVIGLLPTVRSGTVPKVLVGMLVGFAVWSGLSLAWTDSAERTAIEIGRVATYLGFFVLALGLVNAGRRRQVLGAATTAIGLIVVLAALSRLEPSLFPEQDAGAFIRGISIESRLGYPFNYSSALAGFTAMAIPLLLGAAAFGRSAWVRSPAIATIPFAALTLWFTGSSLAIPMTAIGVIALLVLSRDRLLIVATLALATLGSAAVVLAANSRDALNRGLLDAEAASQGDEILAVTLLAAAVIALVHAWVAVRYSDWGPRLRPPSIPPRARRAGIVAATAVALVVVAFGGGKIANQWDSFRSADGLDPNEGSRTEQVLDVSSRGRYQYWQTALDAFEEKPLTGIGAGTYEFWWAQHGSNDGAIFVRDAHSLYLETLAELGIVGLLLIGGFIGLVLVAGSLNAVRSTTEDRPGMAAAVAACWVFAAAAGVDWMWEVAAFPITFLILAAVAATPRPTKPGAEAPGLARRMLHGPAPTVAMALLAIIVIAMPVASESLLGKSRTALVEGRNDDALDAALDAVSVQPYAATPRLQEAFVLEELGRGAAAIEAGKAATEREPTNWRTWIILAEIQARAGRTEDAVASYRRADELNPRLVQAPGS